MLNDSTVKREHLDTVDQRDIHRTIGRLSAGLMQRLEGCIKSALSIP
ncbi:MAG: hypothetical protein WD403_04950 [Pirellulales bacterium]